MFRLLTACSRSRRMRSWAACWSIKTRTESYRKAPRETECLTQTHKHTHTHTHTQPHTNAHTHTHTHTHIQPHTNAHTLIRNANRGSTTLSSLQHTERPALAPPHTHLVAREHARDELAVDLADDSKLAHGLLGEAHGRKLAAQRRESVPLAVWDGNRRKEPRRENQSKNRTRREKETESVRKECVCVCVRERERVCVCGYLCVFMCV
jgi:hypothetical protein